jgi:hypothetical protein
MKRVERALRVAAVASIGLCGCQGSESVGASASAPGSPPEPTPSATELRLARGEYLVDHVGICLYCHSERDWTAPGFPEVANARGGGAVFPDEGVPGFVVSRNITPHALGDCTDEEIARAIREGMGCDGTRLFPAMPYHYFRAMADDDVAAVVAYLRTLEPIDNELPRTEVPEQVWATLPPHVPITEPVVAPDPSDPLAYGAYLATIGLCVECHTPIDAQGVPIGELGFGGGRIFVGPWGTVASANLTPAPSGIPHYDEALFRQVLRTCAVGARELNRLMPCEFYKGLSDADMSALFAYLQSLAPVDHSVSNVDEATPCARCGVPHGLGTRNAPLDEG